MSLTRRHFLGASAAAVIAAGTVTKGKVYGANDKIGVCVMGLRGRGSSHLKAFSESKNSEVVAVCDADERILNSQARAIERATGKAPKTYTDIRDALADDAVHALSIATPNHWHTLATIWGCEAGKDVFVEKPATHNVWEGQQLIAAAKKYDRIVMHGTQNRSSRKWLRDIPLLQSGEIIGPLYMARGLCYKHGNRGSIGFREVDEVPEHLHWRLWQGPATDVDYHGNYHPYNWHWFWHFGNGEIGNQGIHQLDIAVWGMNKGLPVKVNSDGGRFTYEDQGESPNTNTATFTYEDGTMMVFDVRNRFTNDEAGVRVGNLFYGEEGYYVENQGFFDNRDKLIKVDDKKYPAPESLGHYENFLAAIRSRKEEDIYGNAWDAHVSSAHAHLANVAYRVGHTLKFDPKTEQFVDAPEGTNALLTREYAPGFEVPQLA